MCTGFMGAPSISESWLTARHTPGQKPKTPLWEEVFHGGEGGIRTREPCGLHAFQACALSQLRDLSV
jgi:hypothetical protein